MTDLLAWGVVAHLVGDWLLQNHWMAENKVSLRHPAAYVHSGIHAALLCLVFPAPIALGLGAAHLLIDTRAPRRWWARFIRQTTDPGERISLHVAVWADQVMHVACIALAARFAG